MNYKIISIIILFIFNSCSSNSINQKQEKPYILLISIDGYRHDYTEKFKPPFLSKFKSTAARLKSLRPSFPTKTFPNHLSIVTGQYPMHHGIVANKFYVPKFKSSYRLGDNKSVQDGKFYSALPFWGLAEAQNIKTATYFWPGSEAKIKGHRPSYYLNYKHSTPHKQRIEGVLNWFELPLNKRPHFVSLYFHDVDSAGHKFGTNAKETKEAVLKVDNSLNILSRELKKLHLPINIIIVSDHGMMDLPEENVESIIKDKKDTHYLNQFKAMGKGPIIHLYKKESITSEVVKQALASFNQGAYHYKCYTNNNTPKKLNFRNNPRIGDIVCIADYKWGIFVKKQVFSKAGHGWSQYKTKDMDGIFYAMGPNFKNIEIPTQDNIHIFPVLAKILDLKIDYAIDGDLNAMKDLIKLSKTRK